MAWYLLSIRNFWSLKFLSRQGDKFFHIMNLLRYISLSWCAICTLLNKINTWFFCMISFLVIIYFSMLLRTIMLLFWDIQLQRVQIHQRLILHIMMWLIIWDMICWRKFNKKMILYVITLIIDVGRNMKWIMKLNIYMMLWNKILDRNYTYGSLKQPI